MHWKLETWVGISTLALVVLLVSLSPLAAQVIPDPSPPATGAGELEPPSTAVDSSGNPTATTQTQPSWDQVLPANERFILFKR